MKPTNEHGKAAARTAAITTEPVAITLYRLTLPMTGGIVALMGLGLADAYFIAQIGLNELAALGFALPVTYGVNSIGLGLGMAISVLVSRYLGQNRPQAAARLITDARILVIVAGLGLQLMLYCSLEPLLSLMGAGQQVLGLAAEFMALWLPVVPVLLLTLTANTTLRAIGSPGKSAAVLALLAIANAALDPLLIFGYGPLPGIGIAGAGLASALAWLIAFTVSDYMLGTQERLILRGHLRPRPMFLNWRRLLTVGIPAIVANLTTPLAAAILTALIATYGATAIAGFTVATRIEALCLLVVFALSSTLPMFIGQNLGARRYDRIETALFGTLRFSLLLQALIWLALLPGAQRITPWFSDNPEVSTIANLYLWIVPLSYGGQAITILVMVSLNVLQRPKTALWVTVLRLLLITLPLALLGSYLGGLSGLFTGFAIGNAFAGVIAWRIAKSVWQEHVNQHATRGKKNPVEPG